MINKSFKHNIIYIKKTDNKLETKKGNKNLKETIKKMEKLYKATIFQVNEELGYIQNGAFHNHFINTDEFGNIEYKTTLQPHRKIIGTIIPPYYLKEKNNRNNFSNNFHS